MYKPKPIDTSDVQLDKNLIQLTELIAENVHEVWADGRIREGWTYGPNKDSLKKETPCLVPYKDLTDAEKSFDRNTAMETLKFIVKMGYKISK